MNNRILEVGVGNVYLTYISGFKLLKEFLREKHTVIIKRIVDYIRIILMDLVALTLKSLKALTTESIDKCCVLIEALTLNKLNDI